MTCHPFRALALATLLALALPAAAQEQPPGDDARFEALEERIGELEAELRAQPAAPDDDDDLGPDDDDDDDDDGSLLGLDLPSWLERLSINGYGELHGNFKEGTGGDQFDIHRLVFAVSYRFTDWVYFTSEIEIEHAFVKDGDGELVVEQAFLDFSVWTPLNFRVGRILTPVGIVNSKHEPPSFNGVERPNFSKYVLPSTWSSDGVGIYGNLTPWIQYQVYAVASLDGSGFGAKEGIRGGRMKERPGLNQPGATGRIDLFPFVNFAPPAGQVLRLGVSAFYGGLDNGDQGKDPDVDGTLQLFSADFEYTIWRFDFRGALATIHIDGAKSIGNGTASHIFGYFAEVAVHVWPDAFKGGILGKSDLVLFFRYDDYDTQDRMPKGVARDKKYSRRDYTFGLSFYVLPNLVIKADVQIQENDVKGSDLPLLGNVGLGWQF